MPIVFLAFVIAGWLWPITMRGLEPAGIQFSTGELPHRAWYAATLKDGRIPIWNEDDGFGTPELARGRIGVFYPSNLLLYRLFEFRTAYRISLVGHCILAAVFAYLCARGYQLSQRAALLTSVVFAGQGFFIIHAGHQWALTTACWLPLAVLAVHRWFQTCEARWLLLLAATITVQLLAGHFQIAVYTQLVVLAIGIVSAFRMEGTVFHRAKSFIFLATAWIGAIAGAAVQLVPTAELLVRADWRGWDWDFLSSYGIPPLHLGGLFAPTLLQQNPLWRQMAWVPWRSAPTECLMYFGLIPLGLAIWAIPKSRSDRNVRVWSILALLTIALCLGPWLPGYRWLAQFPVFGWFSAPARWSVVFGLFVALLAGWTLDRIECEQFVRWIRRFVIIALIVVGLTIVGITSVARGTPDFAKPVDPQIGFQLLDHGYTRRQIRRRSISPEGEMSAMLTDELKWPAINLGLLLLAVGPWPLLRKRNRLTTLVVIWSAIDLGIAATLLRKVDFESAVPIDERSSLLQQIAGRHVRVAGTTSAVPMAIGMTPLTKSDVPDMQVCWNTGGGIDASAWNISIPSIPNLERWGDFAARLADSPGSLREDEFEFLRLSGVSQIVLGPGMGRPKEDLPLIRRHVVPDLWLSAQILGPGTQHLPEAANEWSTWEFASDVTVSRAWIFPVTDPPVAGTDPRLLRRPPPGRRAMLENATTASVIVDEGEHLQIEGSTVGRSVVVISDLNYPGWSATLSQNGESIPLEIQTAFGNWRAVLVAEPGPFRIDFHYRPRSFVVGGWISLGAVVFGCLCFASLGIRGGKPDSLRSPMDETEKTN